MDHEVDQLAQAQAVAAEIFGQRLQGFDFERGMATADLLGQMAASDYIEKLPLLYDEFAEAARHNPEIAALQMFSSASDLIRKTPAFWKHHVRDRLNREFEGVYRYLNDPWPDGFNPYLARIEANIARIPTQPPAQGA